MCNPVLAHTKSTLWPGHTGHPHVSLQTVDVSRDHCKGAVKGKAACCVITRRLSVSMVDDGGAGGGADDVDTMPLMRRLERLASNRSHAVSEVASAAAGPAEHARNAGVRRVSRAGSPTGASRPCPRSQVSCRWVSGFAARNVDRCQRAWPRHPTLLLFQRLETVPTHLAVLCLMLMHVVLTRAVMLA